MNTPQAQTPPRGPQVGCPLGALPLHPAASQHRTACSLASTQLFSSMAVPTHAPISSIYSLPRHLGHHEPQLAI